MELAGDSELALGILSGRQFTQEDSIRIVADLYPHHKRYTFKESKHSEIWRTLCASLRPMTVVTQLGGVELSPDGRLTPSSSSWGTARNETHALMCGTTEANQQWLSIHATTLEGLLETRDVLIRNGYLPTEAQARAKQAQVIADRFAVISAKGFHIGSAVKSMFRCDAWAGTVTDISDAGLLTLLLKTGQAKVVKPTAIQVQ